MPSPRPLLQEFHMSVRAVSCLRSFIYGTFSLFWGYGSKRVKRNYSFLVFLEQKNSFLFWLSVAKCRSLGLDCTKRESFFWVLFSLLLSPQEVYIFTEETGIDLVL